MERPLGVNLISFYYFIGAVFLITTVLFFEVNSNEIGLTERFGLSWFPEKLFRVILAIFTLIMIYGYGSLTRWGFWLMSSYSLLFCLISLVHYSIKPEVPLFLGNFIRSLIVLVYTVVIRKSFFQNDIS